MKKILLIEDDIDLLGLLRYNLEREGFRVATRQSGKGAVEFCRLERPDLVILDIMLPDLDGLEVCKAIRAQQELSHLPVIFLSARGSETDRIVGLELGANDYVVKPFSVRELLARVKVQFRRQWPRTQVLRAAGVELDESGCRVWINGRRLSLTSTEFRLLKFLMSHPGIVFSRQQLLDAVWGPGRAITDRAIDVYVLRLRNKLETDPANPVLIRAARGFGYCFEDGGDVACKEEGQASTNTATPATAQGKSEQHPA